jgi:hypothetical protein
MIDHRDRYWFDLSLIRPVRFDRESVDIGLKHLRESLVDHSMAFDSTTCRKCGRNYLNLEMPLAVPCPGVPGMQVTLVLDQQSCGGESSGQNPVNSLGTLAAHGSTSLKGLTVTAA